MITKEISDEFIDWFDKNKFYKDYHNDLNSTFFKINFKTDLKFLGGSYIGTINGLMVNTEGLVSIVLVNNFGMNMSVDFIDNIQIINTNNIFIFDKD